MSIVTMLSGRARLRAVAVMALVVALPTVTSAPGADHEVQRVVDPHVVQHVLGPSMEIARGYKSPARELRHTSYPGSYKGCFSCTLAGTSYGSGSSFRSSSYGEEGGYGAIVPAGGHTTTSSRQEVRSEQQFVNGQPVYQLQHERRFKDGRLIHDQKVEKDEHDLGFHVGTGSDYPGSRLSTRGGSRSSSYNQVRGGYHTPHGYDDSFDDSYVQGPGTNLGSAYVSEDAHDDDFASDFQSNMALLHQNLQRQMTYRTHQPVYGGSHRSEVHSETRYVNGQPVYEKHSERKYKDGQLVHNRTEEKGPEDLGTEDIVNQYQSNVAPVGGYYEDYRQSSSTHRDNQDTYPRYTPGFSSYSQYSQHSSSIPAHLPVSTTQFTHESRDSSIIRPSTGLSPSQVQQSRDSVSAYPSYRPVPGRSSTQYTDQSLESGSSSYSSNRPAPGRSSTQYAEQSFDSSSYPSNRPALGSSTQYDDHSRESLSHRPTSPSSSYPSHTYITPRPASGSSLTQYTEETKETSASSSIHRPNAGRSNPPYSPSSGSYSTYESSSHAGVPQTRPTNIHRASGAAEVTQQTRPINSDRSSSTAEVTQHTRPISSNRGSVAAEVTQHTRPTSNNRGSVVAEVTHSTQAQQNIRTLQPHQPVTQISQENFEISQRESSSGYRHHVPSRPAGGYSDNHLESSQDHYSEYNVRRPEVTRTSGGARTTILDLPSSASQTSPTSGRHHDTRVDDVYSPHGSQPQVGIPGALIGPVVDDNDEDEDDDNKERYDISPHEDNYGPEIPSVDNEQESFYIPTLASVDNEAESSDTSQEDDESSHTLDKLPSLHPSRGDNRLPNLHPTRLHPTRVDESSSLHRTRVDGSSNTHQRGPYSSVHSSSYYNSTHTRQGTLIDQAVPVVSNTHLDFSGASTADERRNVYPSVVGSTSYKYNESRSHSTVVGGLYPSQPLPGSQSTSSSSSDTSSTSCTEAMGCFVIESPQLGSRRTDIRKTKKYINGRLVGVTHHERQYENGKLIHENTKEHGSDELEGMDLSSYGDDQLQLMHGSYHPGSYSQRHEVRQEKKFVNGQQVYDLHHERRFEDDRLVHENRTEKDEDDFGVGRLSVGHLGVLSHQDSEVDNGARHEVTQSQHLQQHVTSGRVAEGGVGRSSLTHQVSETGRVSVVPQYTSHRYEQRSQHEFVDGKPVYDLHHERRFLNGSLVYENRTELNEEDLSGAVHYDALHNILAGNTLNTPSETSYTRNTESPRVESYGSYSESLESSHRGGSEASPSSSARGILKTYGGSGTIRGSSTGRIGATTTILDTSRPLLTGSDSVRSGSSAQERSSHESFGSESHSASTGGTRRTGCLSCILLAGSGYSSQDSSRRSSLGYSGAGSEVGRGYSQRKEMSMEEHYEDGQLVHGRQDSRRFKDGQLVQENRRQYSESPSQASYPAALETATTSYASPALSSPSLSGSGTGVREAGVESSLGVCDSSTCQNGGTCLVGLHGPICACNFGFRGPECAELHCPKGFCRRGGSCSIEDGVHVCVCRGGFSGYRCETRTKRHTRKFALAQGGHP